MKAERKCLLCCKIPGMITVFLRGKGKAYEGNHIKEEETVQEQKVQDGKAQEKNGTEEPKDWNSRREHRDQKEAGKKEAREDQEDMSSSR